MEPLGAILGRSWAPKRGQLGTGVGGARAQLCCSRRRRGKRARDEPPEFVEVRQADLIGEGRVDSRSAAADALGKEHIQNLRNNVRDKGTGLARRRHQIGTLYRNAQLAEIEALEGRGTQTKSKRETTAKYGW